MKLFIHLFINDWLLITVQIQTSTYTRTSSKMSGRKVNSNEIKLHGAALANNDKVSYCIACSPLLTYSPEQILTMKQAEKLLPDPKARTEAINFLLGAVRVTWWARVQYRLIGCHRVCSRQWQALEVSARSVL